MDKDTWSRALVLFSLLLVISKHWVVVCRNRNSDGTAGMSSPESSEFAEGSGGGGTTIFNLSRFGFGVTADLPTGPFGVLPPRRAALPSIFLRRGLSLRVEGTSAAVVGTVLPFTSRGVGEAKVWGGDKIGGSSCKVSGSSPALTGPLARLLPPLLLLLLLLLLVLLLLLLFLLESLVGVGGGGIRWERERLSDDEPPPPFMLIPGPPDCFN